MRHPPLAPGWIDRPHHERAIGDLALDSGETLRDARLVWVEHGRRDPQGDNTVLVCCAIGSTHHRLDFLIGEGRALDTRRWHVLVIDALGNGLSSSPSNSRLQPGPRFPRIGIGDMVESQRMLLDALGIGRLAAVVGASMGGMQALHWAVAHADRVARVVAMTPMAKASRWSQLVNEISRRALFEDDACTRPRPREDAMRLWVPLTQLVVPTTPESVAGFAGERELLDWLGARQTVLAEHGPDCYDWLCQTRAYDAHDVGCAAGFRGDTEAALRAIRARTLVLAPPLDLYNPSDCARGLAATIPHARVETIPSIRGHQAASGVDDGDVAFLDDVIGRFLD